MFPFLKILKQLKTFLQNSSVCISSHTIPASSSVFSWCFSLAYSHQAKENLALGVRSWHSDLVLSITSLSVAAEAGAALLALGTWSSLTFSVWHGFRAHFVLSPNGEWGDEKWACKNLSTASNFLINSLQQHNFDPVYSRAVCYMQVCSILQDWQRRVNLSF